MKNKLNKKEILNLLKKAINIECYVEYINNYFTIDLKGEIVPEQNKNITLKSIYELMSNKFDAIDKRFDKLESQTNEKFKLIDKRFDKFEYETNEKFKLIDKRFDKLESQTNEKFKLIDTKLKSIDNRLSIIENIPTIKEELNKI